MAARLRKTHQDDVRAKIQASQLINVLQNHALGLSEELPQSRLKAIEILLKKTVPDLSQMDSNVNHSGEVGTTIQIVRFSDDNDSTTK